MFFFLKLSVAISLFLSSSAYGMRKHHNEEPDLKRDVSARKYRGEYSVELEFKTLAEKAAGNSLTKEFIERYYVAKAQFEKDKDTFSQDEVALCQSRMDTIEEGIQKHSSNTK